MTISVTRKLSGIALAAVMVAACGGSATQPPASQPGATLPASGGPTTPVPPSASVTLQGAGSTFAALLYQVWSEKFNGLYGNVQINYTANGSGAGIKAITQQTVDFGATDAAMKDTEIAALPAGTTMLHIPTALGAVVLIFNVKGKDGNPVTKLNLDGPTIAGIFLGTITKWSDPAIAAINADTAANLPDTAIVVVHRSDGSGTTNAFTSYLDAVSPDWHTKVGVGKAVNWPVGNGAPGNDGISGQVKQTDGAIGYVELQYAVISGLSSAAVKNAAGKFVAGSTQGVTDAANAVLSSFPADFRQAPIINAAGDSSYPIASYTYVLAYQSQTDATKGQALVAFLYWALTAGQNEEKAVGYAPLPDQVDQKALAELHQITANGAPIWP